VDLVVAGLGTQQQLLVQLLDLDLPLDRPLPAAAPSRSSRPQSSMRNIKKKSLDKNINNNHRGVGAPSTLGFNTFTPGPQTTTASAGLLFSATGSAGGFGTASGTGFGPLGSASSLPSPSTPVGVGLLNPAPTKKKR